MTLNFTDAIQDLRNELESGILRPKEALQRVAKDYVLQVPALANRFEKAYGKIENFAKQRQEIKNLEAKDAAPALKKIRIAELRNKIEAGLKNKTPQYIINEWVTEANSLGARFCIREGRRNSGRRRRKTTGRARKSYTAATFRDIMKDLFR